MSVDSIQGKYRMIDGSGKLSFENNGIMPLVAGKALKILHPVHGWVQGIYQGNGEVVLPHGTYTLQEGDEVRILK
jgi:Trk K+ transport system NAD-binding subunit